MRIAVLSDIHANILAFEAVLADMAGQRVDAVYSLGDNVGYGPRPAEVMARLTAEAIPSVMGNHEEAIVDPKRRGWFNPYSREAVEITDTLLDEGHRALFRAMPDHMVAHGCRMVHGCPPAYIRVYLYQPRENKLAEILDSLPERIHFAGHTHDLELISLKNGELDRHPLHPGEADLDPEARHIVNVGSVGQPRDGDNRAKYAIYAPDTGLLEIRAVAYDWRTTMRDILDRGIPEAFANRLAPRG